MCQITGIVLFCICSDIDVDHNNYLSLPLAELSGIFVKSIADGSAASVDGKLRINDQIIEVHVQTNSNFAYNCMDCRLDEFFFHYLISEFVSFIF